MWVVVWVVWVVVAREVVAMAMAMEERGAAERGEAARGEAEKVARGGGEVVVGRGRVGGRGWGVGCGVRRSVCLLPRP